MSALDTARERVADYLDKIERMTDENGDFLDSYTDANGTVHTGTAQEDYDNAQIEAEYKLMDLLIELVNEIDAKETAP